MSVAAVASALGLGWDLVNTLAVDAARALVYDDPTHLDEVRHLGVDEHCWKHVRGQGEDNFATILVDLTPHHRGHRPGAAARCPSGPLGEDAHPPGWTSATRHSETVSRW